MAENVYKCALCGALLKGKRPSRCPECGGKAFVHVSGDPIRRKAGCTGSCSGCTGCQH